MTTNRTSEAVETLGRLMQLFNGTSLPVGILPRAHYEAIAEKYKRYENYALGQAQSGDKEAQDVLDFDPLA